MSESRWVGLGRAVRGVRASEAGGVRGRVGGLLRGRRATTMLGSRHVAADTSTRPLRPSHRNSKIQSCCEWDDVDDAFKL